MSEKPTTTDEARAALRGTGLDLIEHLKQSGTGAGKLEELDAMALRDPQLTAASVRERLLARLFSGTAAKARKWMLQHCPDELTEEPRSDLPTATEPSGEEVTKPQDEATHGGEPEQTEDPVGRGEAGVDQSKGGDPDLRDPGFDRGEDFEGPVGDGFQETDGEPDEQPQDGGRDDPEEQLQPA